jgi:hypothetical protein
MYLPSAIKLLEQVSLPKCRGQNGMIILVLDKCEQIT